MKNQELGLKELGNLISRIQGKPLPYPEAREATPGVPEDWDHSLGTDEKYNGSEKKPEGPVQKTSGDGAGSSDSNPIVLKKGDDPEQYRGTGKYIQLPNGDVGKFD